MSPYINGDRLIYIAENAEPPLPKETVIGGFPCRIWHKSQKNFCKRCASHGHRTSDVGLCEAYDPDSAVSAFRADKNPLSNYFYCSINVDNIMFKTLEHAYQYQKCVFLNRLDLADDILNAETPREAKSISAQLSLHDGMVEWNKVKVDIMGKLLKTKWSNCAQFSHTLMSTAGMTIAEATSDMFWGVGVAPNLAQYTKPSKFLGLNQLGKCLMVLRDTDQKTYGDDHTTTPPDCIHHPLP